MLNIESGDTKTLGLLFKKGGNPIPAPDGYQVAFSPITDTVDGASGTLAADGLTAQLTGGPAGDTGSLTAVVTLADGSTLTTPEFDFTDIAAVPDSVEIIAQ